MTGENTAEMSEADKNVEIWKVKKLIKSLEAARGSVPARTVTVPSAVRAEADASRGGGQGRVSGRAATAPP